MTIDEFLERLRDKKPPAPAKDVRKLESKLGSPLPGDYRDFLIRSNGGYVGGSLWFMGLPGHEGSADAGVHHVFGFENGPNSLSENLETTREADLQIPKGLLPIMVDPFGNWICLDVTGANPGRVCFWDHETQEIATLTSSFTEFVAGLQPTPQD